MSKQRDGVKDQLDALKQGKEMTPNEIATLKSDINKINSDVEGLIL